MKVFLSYRFADEGFVRSTNYYLTKQSDLETFFYGGELHDQHWVSEVSTGFADAEAFLLFMGTDLGITQELEARALLDYLRGREVRVIKLPGFEFPDRLAIFRGFMAIEAKGLGEQAAQQCAKAITTSLGKQWVPHDDIPDEYIFDYEKDIIQAYSADTITPELIGKGCPSEWPKVERKERRIESPLKEDDVGLFRDWDRANKKYREEESLVFAGALKSLADNQSGQMLGFPEAGPRKSLAYPAQVGVLKVGIVVSGGIAPGINGVIAGIVERQVLYAESGGYEEGLVIKGYQNGLNAIYYAGEHYRPLGKDEVANRADRGGSILGTSRLSKFMDPDPLERRKALERAVHHLSTDGVEILYVIGGDGSLRAAHALSKTAREMGKKISIVGVPKTMDNDILWVWQSFGFLSAVERSRDLIQELFTETKSNPRLCVIQLFGSDSGFVVTHAVSALGVCDLFLIPEVPFKMKNVCEYVATKLKERYWKSRGLESTYGMIVMSETAIPQDAEDYFDDPEVALTDDEKTAISDFLLKKRVFGQTPDELRSGGLKLVSRVIQKFIKDRGDVFPQPYWRKFRVFTNEPRHLIRAIAPSSSDTITAKRLGSLAVDGAMAGYTDFMISQWLTEYVMVPLRLVVLGRKRIPRYGVFYKSARASTGQPSYLGEDDVATTAQASGD